MFVCFCFLFFLLFFFINKLLNCYCSSDLPCRIPEHKYGTCAYCIFNVCFNISYFDFFFYIIALMIYLKYINIMTTVLYY